MARDSKRMSIKDKVALRKVSANSKLALGNARAENSRLRTKLFGTEKHAETMKGLRNAAKQAKYDYKLGKRQAKVDMKTGTARTKQVQSVSRNLALAAGSISGSNSKTASSLASQIGMFKVDEGKPGETTTDTPDTPTTNPNPTID